MQETILSTVDRTERETVISHSGRRETVQVLGAWKTRIRRCAKGTTPLTLWYVEFAGVLDPAEQRVVVKKYKAHSTCDIPALDDALPQQQRLQKRPNPRRGERSERQGAATKFDDDDDDDRDLFRSGQGEEERVDAHPSVTRYLLVSITRRIASLFASSLFAATVRRNGTPHVRRRARLARRGASSGLVDALARRAATSRAPARRPRRVRRRCGFAETPRAGRAFRRLVVVRGRGTRARGRDARLGNAHAPSGPDAVVVVVVVVAVVVDGTDESLTARGELFARVRFQRGPRALESTVGGDVGSTIRERWRRTYATEKPDGTRSTRLGLQMLASNKFRVVASSRQSEAFRSSRLPRSGRTRRGKRAC